MENEFTVRKVTVKHKTQVAGNLKFSRTTVVVRILYCMDTLRSTYLQY
jgi:hypothetical protein